MLREPRRLIGEHEDAVVGVDLAETGNAGQRMRAFGTNVGEPSLRKSVISTKSVFRPAGAGPPARGSPRERRCAGLAKSPSKDTWNAPSTVRRLQPPREHHRGELGQHREGEQEPRQRSEPRKGHVRIFLSPDVAAQRCQHSVEVSAGPDVRRRLPPYGRTDTTPRGWRTAMTQLTDMPDAVDSARQPADPARRVDAHVRRPRRKPGASRPGQVPVSVRTSARPAATRYLAVTVDSAAPRRSPLRPPPCC